MRVRLSVFLLIDEQWRQNLVKTKNKKQKNKHQRHTQAPLLYVLPFFRSSYFDVTHDQPLKKNMAKFDVNFLSITYL